jgi:serine protease Do
MKSKIVLFLSLASIFFTFFIAPKIQAQDEGVLSSLEESITKLVESVKPSLVTIKAPRSKEVQIYLDALKKSVKEKKEIKKEIKTFVGSGIVLSEDGNILTTASTVGGNDKFEVEFLDGRKFEATLAGRDDEENIAIIKVQPKGSFVPAKLGNSDKLKEGSWVIVVGNSYGLPNAVAMGVINGIREDGLIQMSANVSPGNSGGPVLNSSGKVVGIVSAKVSEPSLFYFDALKGNVGISIEENEKSLKTYSGSVDLPTSGISIAIPINKVKTLADEIIAHGGKKSGYLGIYPEDLDEDTKDELGIEEGVIITGVVEDGPAEKAGIEDEDVIIEFNGIKVKTASQLRKMIQKAKPEERVKLKIVRDGKEKILSVEIGESKGLYSIFQGPDGKAFGFTLPEPALPPQTELQEIPSIPVPTYKYWDKEKSQEVYDKLKEEIDKLKEQMDKLNQELQRLQEEKLKETKEKVKKINSQMKTLLEKSLRDST